MLRGRHGHPPAADCALLSSLAKHLGILISGKGSQGVSQLLAPPSCDPMPLHELRARPFLPLDNVQRNVRLLNSRYLVKILGNEQCQYHAGMISEYRIASP